MVTLRFPIDPRSSDNSGLAVSRAYAGGVHEFSTVDRTAVEFGSGIQLDILLVGMPRAARIVASQWDEVHSVRPPSAKLCELWGSKLRNQRAQSEPIEQ